MNYSDIDEINEDEVNALLENEVIENAHLEYKKDIKFNNDNEKKELLADICSFSNIGGGIILYGIEEKREEGKTTGLPSSICGLNINIDEITRRIDESVRHSIEPRIIGLKIKQLEVAGKLLLVVFIPRSMNPPHMVTFKGSCKFWRRANASKYQMGMEEIRESILGGNNLRVKIKEFRDQRLGSIISDETPVELVSNPKVVLHVIPIDNFLNPKVDISKINHNARLAYYPVTGASCNERLNFDGFFTYWASSYKSGGENYSYNQVYRSGVVESVDAFSIVDRGEGGEKIIPSLLYEQELIQFSQRILKNLEKDGISGPVILYLSLLGVKGYEMGLGSDFFPRFSKTTIDKNDLILPELYIEDISQYSATSMLKSSFDLVWNACGFERSLNYDENGNWKSR